MLNSCWLRYWKIQHVLELPKMLSDTKRSECLHIHAGFLHGNARSSRGVARGHSSSLGACALPPACGPALLKTPQGAALERATGRTRQGGSSEGHKKKTLLKEAEASKKKTEGAAVRGGEQLTVCMGHP